MMKNSKKWGTNNDYLIYLRFLRRDGEYCEKEKKNLQTLNLQMHFHRNVFQ